MPGTAVFRWLIPVWQYPDMAEDTRKKYKNTKHTQTIFLKTCSGQQFFTDNSTFPSSASPCAKPSPQAQTAPTTSKQARSPPRSASTLGALLSLHYLPLSITLLWQGKSTSGTHLQPSVPSRKGPASHWNGTNGNGIKCQGELHRICSMLCSGQPSPQLFQEGLFIRSYF